MMKERDVRLNIITLDFANELGEDDDSSESDKENEIAEELGLSCKKNGKKAQ